jgi:hypothetical protein
MPADVNNLIYAKYVAAYTAALTDGDPRAAAFDWQDTHESLAAIAIGAHDGKNNKEPQSMVDVFIAVRAMASSEK